MKQHTPSQAASYYQKPKMLIQNSSGKSSANFRGSSYLVKNQTVQGRSLVQQYDALDAGTKHAFNEAFLKNLESVKYNMGQLMS